MGCGLSGIGFLMRYVLLLVSINLLLYVSCVRLVVSCGFVLMLVVSILLLLCYSCVDVMIISFVREWLRDLFIGVFL